MFQRKHSSSSLTAEEAESRIRKMIAFILNDAYDKAAEIHAQTEQDALNLYQQHLAEAEQRLRSEYEDKRRRAEAAYRRRQGQKLVAAELEVQSMRWEKVKRVQQSAHQRLAALCQPQPSDTSYGTFMAYLMAEGLLRVADEDRVRVRYREEDAALMATVREQGLSLATGVLRSKAGVEKSWCVELSEGAWSPAIQLSAVEEAKKKDSTLMMQQLQQQPADTKSLGGLVVLANYGRIRVNNTVEERMTRTIHALLPVIRAMLWGNEKGYVHRIVEQRRGKRKTGRRKRVVRWEKHEAHIIAVEEDDKPEDDWQNAADGKEGKVAGTAREDRREKSGGKEEKKSEQGCWREHEPELKVLPT